MMVEHELKLYGRTYKLPDNPALLQALKRLAENPSAQAAMARIKFGEVSIRWAERAKAKGIRVTEFPPCSCCEGIRVTESFGG